MIVLVGIVVLAAAALVALNQLYVRRVRDRYDRGQFEHEDAALMTQEQRDVTQAAGSASKYPAAGPSTPWV